MGSMKRRNFFFTMTVVSEMMAAEARFRRLRPW